MITVGDTGWLTAEVGVAILVAIIVKVTSYDIGAAGDPAPFAGPPDSAA